MKRNCPKCKNKTISILGLILSKPKCQNCKSLVGHHWIFNAVFICVSAVAIGFLSLYLQVTIELSVAIKVAIFFSSVFFSILLWSLFSPLEVKLNKWAP